MENAEKITHKTYRESLQNNQDIIRQSLELATIHCEVPVKLDLEASQTLRTRPETCLRAFSRARVQAADARIRRFRDRFSSRQPVGRHTAIHRRENYAIINDREDLDKLIRTLFGRPNTGAFDVNDSNSNEKSSCFDKERAASASPSASATARRYYIDLENFEGGRDEAVGTAQRDILIERFSRKVAHDDKAKPWRAAERWAFEPAAVKDDMMIAAYLLDSTRSNYPIPFSRAGLSRHRRRAEVPEGFDEIAFRTAETRRLRRSASHPSCRKRSSRTSIEKVYARSSCR